MDDFLGLRCEGLEGNESSISETHVENTFTLMSINRREDSIIFQLTEDVGQHTEAVRVFLRVQGDLGRYR